MLEIREAEGSPGLVSGTLVKYGDIAQVRGYKESFAPGAFGDLAKANVFVRFMHQRRRPLGRNGIGGLTLFDSPTELRFEHILPDTADGRDTAILVRNQTLGGASAEFSPGKYDINHRERAVIHRQATLVGLSLVDIPAYPHSNIEIRWEDEQKETPPLDLRKYEVLWL